MEKNYRFAGIDLVIDIPDDKIYVREDHLAPFRVETVRDPHRFVFALRDTLEGPPGRFVAAAPGIRIYQDECSRVRYVGAVQDSWENAYLRAEHADRDHRVQLLSSRFPEQVGVKTVLNCLETERLVTEAGGYVFHCSYIDLDGRAILFTAPSGVGKSTQAELWRSLRGAQIVNGDRAVIRASEDGVLACGLPFAGSSQYCLNRDLPVAAVVYLGQAPRTTIRRLRGYEAFARIWEGCSVNLWEPEQLQRISKLVEQTAAMVPVYHLPCTPDESAVETLENALREGSNHE